MAGGGSAREAPPDRGGAPRDAHPEGAEWRADALARSRHSRLSEQLAVGGGELDPARAEALCAEVCRAGLRDLAPALILLAPAERRRAQALAAYAFTLFDFARQFGMEGERLAQINRWEFELEAALAGRPAAQPAFVRMAEEEGVAPWPRESLDDLLRLARRRAARGGPAAAAERPREARELAACLLGALSGQDAPAPAVDLGAALIRLRDLQDLADELRRGRWPLGQVPGVGESPTGKSPTGESQSGGPPPEAEARSAAIAAECREVRALLAAARTAPAALPGAYRRAALYLRLAGGRLERAIGRLGARAAERPAGLGVAARLLLLLRARAARLGPANDHAAGRRMR